jgi:UDP-N-acetylmuramoyl-tripeptide--D-alanyl-D-alanine ligase
VRFSSAHVAAIVGGEHRGPEVDVDGAAIDSRLVRGGELFVPVRGERDGHDFIGAALDAGAAAYLSARASDTGTAIVVADPQVALTALGAAARHRLPERVVGITGSVGKTSTKDLAAAVLARRFVTAASPQSFNNELGVPLTIVNAPDGTEAAVIEMGARGIGHIRDLCAIAAPTVGVVTAVTAAHTELFGSIEEVARAKGELIEALPPDGIAVLNADDERVAAMASRARGRVVLVGAAGDVRATDVIADDELRTHFTLESPEGRTPVTLEMRGIHMVSNALAAAAVGLALGVAIDDVAAGLGKAGSSRWRMEVRRTASGATVVNDAYNANPASTAAALRALVQLPARRRIAVLGPMAELGAGGPAAHARIAALAAELGVRVIAVGTPDYGGETAAGFDGVLAALGALGEGDAVLVKGSRVAGLERLVELLVPAEPMGDRAW